jgi:hypothetical protein
VGISVRYTCGTIKEEEMATVYVTVPVEVDEETLIEECLGAGVAFSDQVVFDEAFCVLVDLLGSFRLNGATFHLTPRPE